MINWSDERRSIHLITFNRDHSQVVLTHQEVCIRDISDIYTKPTQLNSPSSPLLSGLNDIFLARLLLKIGYLAMLFIYQVTHTAGSVGDLTSECCTSYAAQLENTLHTDREYVNTNEEYATYKQRICYIRTEKMLHANRKNVI